MKHILVPIFTLLIGLLDWNAEASAFCGFYVGKADTKLFNKALRWSSPATTTRRHHHGKRFQSDVTEFAMVVRCRRCWRRSKSTSAIRRS